MLDEADHVWEGQDTRFGQVVGVQPEFAVSVLDAHVGGTSIRLDRECEQVAGVGAVPHQEGALWHLLEMLLGLAGCDGSPVPTWKSIPERTR